MVAGAIALAVGAVVPGTQAHAAVKPTNAELERAEELYDNGRALFAEGSYDAASTAFERAYGLSGNLDMLYNAALAYDRAGRFDEAIDALDRYRALAPAAERAALDERKRSLQTRRDKQRQDAETTAAEPEGPPPPPVVATPADAPPPRSPRRVRPPTWTMLGVGVAGAVVGTVLGATSLARSRSARPGCTDGAGPLLCGDDVADAARSSRPLAIGADVAFAIAGAGAIAFVALLALDLRRARRAGASTAITAAPRGLSLAF